MNNYVFDPNRSYAAYLQAEFMNAAAPAELSPRWTMLIGTPIAGLGPAPLVTAADSDPAEAPGTAQPTPTGVRRFHWGHSSHLLFVGQFNLPLTALKHAAKTSAEMWAIEQFDIARDAFRRGLFQESLVYLQRAIEGHDGRDGYTLDYRVHFLLGLIRLGSYQHHDPAVLDLAKAEQAFAAAGRYAACDQPSDAAWAFLAAGWAAYGQGMMAQALTHTRQALLLQPKLGEAHFQAAKILLHVKQPADALPYLTTAVELDTAFALDAARDPNFVPFAAEILPVIEAERQQVGGRASKAMQEVLKQAREIGLLAADGTSALSAGAGGDELSSVSTLLALATASMRTNTLYGYLATEAYATQAGTALKLVIVRCQKARQIAEDSLHAARELAGQIEALQIGSYRLGAGAITEFNKAIALIAQGEAGCKTDSLPAYLEAEQFAKRALVALKSTVESYQASALKQAEAERTALLEEIKLPQKSGHDHGGSIKACALIGALVAIFPGGYASMAGFDSSSGSLFGAALRFFLTIAVATAIGAMLGAMFSPLRPVGAPAPDHRLDARKTALDQTIAKLRGFSFEKIRPAS